MCQSSWKWDEGYICGGYSNYITTSRYINNSDTEDLLSDSEPNLDLASSLKKSKTAKAYIYIFWCFLQMKVCDITFKSSCPFFVSRFIVMFLILKNIFIKLNGYFLLNQKTLSLKKQNQFLNLMTNTPKSYNWN